MQVYCIISDERAYRARSTAIFSSVLIDLGRPSSVRSRRCGIGKKSGSTSSTPVPSTTVGCFRTVGDPRHSACERRSTSNSPIKLPAFWSYVSGPLKSSRRMSSRRSESSSTAGSSDTTRSHGSGTPFDNRSPRSILSPAETRSSSSSHTRPRFVRPTSARTIEPSPRWSAGWLC